MIWSGLVKRGFDREIRAAWPTRSAVPQELWNDLIHRATARIWCAGYTSYFLWTEVPGITPTLPNKAASGLDLRFLLGHKDSPVTRDRERIEDAALHIRRRSPGGLFDQYANHVEHLWEAADSPVPAS
ncbi:hypothetical protein [Micromonospora sp. NBC_01813]|uniref:hypothetical protein n=1 Tax=Micromonospora sp. NBC_01813 TaxID=2975988 RepID=UPI002DDC4810|nr:hypothetical protein [Micromonospora sp. NBC_01813]WSA11368.1 hypothetical protein OG958_11635 [Micromonospora sp. NBC_01813]